MPKLIDLLANSEGLSITVVELGNIISRYRTERVDQLPPQFQEDCTSAWISKAKILDFLAKNPAATGIRFYYGIIDDPFVTQDIHNLVAIGTKTSQDGQEDQISDNDWVMVTRNFDTTQLDGTVHNALCPPPVLRCKGRKFPPEENK